MFVVYGTGVNYRKIVTTSMPQNNVDVTQLDNLSQQELIALRDSYERGELSGGDELKEQITIDELRETLAQAGFHGPLVDIYLKAIDERNKGKLDFYVSFRCVFAV